MNCVGNVRALQSKDTARSKRDSLAGAGLSLLLLAASLLRGTGVLPAQFAYYFAATLCGGVTLRYISSLVVGQLGRRCPRAAGEQRRMEQEGQPVGHGAVPAAAGGVDAPRRVGVAGAVRLLLRRHALRRHHTQVQGDNGDLGLHFVDFYFRVPS